MRGYGFRAWLVIVGTVLAVAIGAGAAGEYAAAYGKRTVQATIKNGTLKVEGTRAGEEISLRLRAGDSSIVEVVTPDGVLPFQRDLFTKIRVEGGDGDDLLRIDDSNGAFTNTEETTLAGEEDDDDLRGGAGNEVLDGGTDDDAADGNQGADVGLMGRGDDSFTWDPGDGSDRVEGSRGEDTLVFNGAAGGEAFDASANGKRLRFFRNLGNIVMDVDDTERLDLRALGGTDSVTMNDVSKTELKEFDIDLAAALGGTAPDGVADLVHLFGGNPSQGTWSSKHDDDEWDDDGHRRRTDDDVRITGADGNVTVAGLSALVRITHADSALDLLDVDTLGGDDVIDATGLPTSAMKLDLDGGGDRDVLRGGLGSEPLAGGSGDDDVDGNQGADRASLGLGDDSFTWDPGDGSDVVEGFLGFDRMIFNGAANNEIFTVNAVGQRVELLRNLGSIDMDLNDVERIDLEALGGLDQTTVNDLAGTDLEDVNIDLEGALGSRTADGVADSVTVNATAGVDVVDIEAVRGKTRVTGLVPTVRIARADPGLDTLVLNTLAGNDQVTVGAGVAALMGVTVND